MHIRVGVRVVPLVEFRAGGTCTAPPSAGRGVAAVACSVRNGRCRGAKRPFRGAAVGLLSLLTRTAARCRGRDCASPARARRVGQTVA